MDAVAAYRKALLLDPDHPAAHCDLAGAYWALNRRAEAMLAYRKAILSNPDDPALHCSMGRAYWEMGRRFMTDVIAGYGNTFMQPEGAGAFHEDPVPWITEGGWNCVQDYGLGIPWEEGTNVIANAIETGDPRPIETALRIYHDRVVEAGGILYYHPRKFDDTDRTHLAFATLLSLGELVVMRYGEPDGPYEDPEVQRLLKLKRVHPALLQRSVRSFWTLSHGDGLRRPRPRI